MSAHPMHDREDDHIDLFAGGILLTVALSVLAVFWSGVSKMLEVFR